MPVIPDYLKRWLFVVAAIDQVFIATVQTQGIKLPSGVMLALSVIGGVLASFGIVSGGTSTQRSDLSREIANNLVEKKVI